MLNLYNYRFEYDGGLLETLLRGKVQAEAEAEAEVWMHKIPVGHQSPGPRSTGHGIFESGQSGHHSIPRLALGVGHKQQFPDPISLLGGGS